MSGTKTYDDLIPIALCSAFVSSNARAPNSSLSHAAAAALFVSKSGHGTCSR